jgi:hypothetical protein
MKIRTPHPVINQPAAAAAAALRVRTQRGRRKVINLREEGAAAVVNALAR